MTNLVIEARLCHIQLIKIHVLIPSITIIDMAASDGQVQQNENVIAPTCYLQNAPSLT